MRDPGSLHRKQAVCAGTFYPASGNELRELFERWAPDRKPLPGLVGLVLPHAGYIYSGPTAAKGYALIPTGVKRILLIGASHHYPVTGVAVWNEGPWETPLGEVRVDLGTVESLLQTGIFHPDPRPFLPEHSLEVQMPFLRHFLQDVPVVPMIAGSLDAHYLEEVADALRNLLDAETLIIASSDLYHGHSYEECVSQDKETLSYVKRMNGKEFLSAARQMRVMACGANAIAVLLETASRLPGSAADVLEYTNSADVTGISDYIVGYAVVAVTAK